MNHFGRELRGIRDGKEIYLQAADGGHPRARYELGGYENKTDNVERAVKHWIIAATQGQNDLIKLLMDAFNDGVVEKEVLAAAMRAHPNQHRL